MEIAPVSAMIEEALRIFLGEQGSRQSGLLLYQEIYQDMQEFILRKGKRIRPLLFLVAYRAFGGDKTFEDPYLLRSAIALELLHGFILIHDDIIDLSDKRRGLPTLHRQIERHLHDPQDRSRIAQGLAMVAGDILFSMASEVIQQGDRTSHQQVLAVRYFQRYVTETGIGEIYDIILGDRKLHQISSEDIVQMYTLKTTRYTFEAPFVLGALFAGVEESNVQEISKVCEPLGLAFQMMNDLDEFQLEDGLQSDLMDAKKTMLLFEAYQGLNAQDQMFLQWCVDRFDEPNALRKIKELIDQSGAVVRLQTKMRNLFNESESRLMNSNLTISQQKGLQDAIAWVRHIASTSKSTHA